MTLLAESFNADLDYEEAGFCHSLGRMIELCHSWFTEVQGFDRNNFDGDCMLIVTELAEAVEADRKGAMDSHVPNRPGRDVELADALVRILHLAGKYDLDLSGAFMEKMRYNLTRPPKHGKAY